MLENIIIGILTVLALGACVWVWWLGNGSSEETDNSPNNSQSEDKKV